MSITEHYQDLQKRGHEALSNLLSDDERLASFTVAHNYTVDFELMYEAIKHRPEAELIKLAIREYQFALYAASSAMYRHAWISLRLSLELSLAAIHFSAHEINLRKWLQNSKDIVWSSLLHEEEGVFAPSFIAAFSPSLKELGVQYSAMTQVAYRECSEFVHGNQQTHDSVGSSIEFDADMLTAWIDRAETFRLCLTFAFAGRYLELLSKDALNRLEPLMLDALGQVPAIRELYGK